MDHPKERKQIWPFIAPDEPLLTCVDRGAHLRGRGRADEERQGGAGADRALLPRRVPDGAGRSGVQGAGGGAAGGLRRPDGEAAGRDQGHVRRREAVRARERHAHGTLEEAPVHGGQVAPHARAGLAGGGGGRGGRRSGAGRLAGEAAQVQGVHAHARLRRLNRGGSRVMDHDHE
jgi:hypothetical protein